MSLPPLARWEFQHAPAPVSPEAEMARLPASRYQVG